MWLALAIAATVLTVATFFGLFNVMVHIGSDDYVDWETFLVPFLGILAAAFIIATIAGVCFGLTWLWGMAL